MRKSLLQRVYHAVFLVVPLSVGLFFLSATSISADTLSEQRSFFVNERYDYANRSQLSATLRTVSDRAYLYVDDAYWNILSFYQRQRAQEALAELGREFDARIYPTETAFWGYEASPGLDNDPRVVILLERLESQAGGYFENIHGYQPTNELRSNARDMIIVSADVLGGVALKTFVAHEFQHLISFNQKELRHNVSEEVWLNEIRSEYAITHAGYDTPYERSTLAARVGAFLSAPSNSLTEWPNDSADYAIASVFGHYLADHYGPGILSETLLYTSTGIASLNEYFARHNLSERFPDVFRNWMLATYLNDVSSDSRFGYQEPDLAGFHVVPRIRTSLNATSGFVASQTIKDWQPLWYELDMAEPEVGPSQAIRLQMIGDVGIAYTTSYLIVYRDGTFDVEDMPLPASGNGIAYLMTPATGPAIDRVIVTVTRRQKVDGFGTNETGSQLSISASLVNRATAQNALFEEPNVVYNSRAGIIRDGMLIKRQGTEPEVYVLSGSYKRYLSPAALMLYPHLNAANAVAVVDSVFNRYATSNYIRAIDDKRVYAVWPDGTKHWMNMTGEYFAQSGRDWNAVFVVDGREVALYTTGANIIR